MGMIWRSTMPLLSTLAALVIIVHSAEEEMERGYRRDLRPRAVDSHSYEQPWKAIDLDPLAPQPTRAETWIESPDDEAPRRRPVRKRKRRPLPYPDTEPQERHQESIQAVYNDADFHDPPRTIEAPRKRRKRPDRPQTDHVNYHFTEQPVKTDDRPTRRRGLRKKRPEFDEQLADIILPMDSEPDEYFNNDKRVENHYNKYTQNNDDYDDIDHTTTEKTTTELNSETDDFKYLLSAHNERIKNLPSFQEHDSEEHIKKYIGVADSVSLVSSSEENQERTLTTIHEIHTEHPREKNIENPNTYDSDSDIMTLIGRPMVQTSKLSIIMNGTEQSYLPLQSVEERVILKDFAFITATQTPKLVTDNSDNLIDLDYNTGISSSSVEVSNGMLSIINNGIEQSYLPLQSEEETVILKEFAFVTATQTPKLVTDNTDNLIDLDYNTGTSSSSVEVSNDMLSIINNVIEQSYLPLQSVEERFILKDFAFVTATQSPKLVTGNSDNLIDLDYSTDTSSSSVEVSNGMLSIINNGAEQSYLPLQSEEETVILKEFAFVTATQAPELVTDNSDNVIGLDYNTGNSRSSTEVSKGAIIFDHDATKLKYIIFPFAPKNIILISRNKEKNKNITMIEFDNGGVYKEIFLPISKEEAFTSTPEEVLNISKEEIHWKEEVFRSMPDEVVNNISKEKIEFVDYAMPIEILNILKEGTIPDYKEYEMNETRVDYNMEETQVDYKMLKETLDDYDFFKEDTDPKAEILVYYATLKEDEYPTEKNLTGYGTLKDKNKLKERIHYVTTSYYVTPSPVKADYVMPKEFISGATQAFSKSKTINYNKTPSNPIVPHQYKWANTHKGIENIKFVPILSPGDNIGIPEKIEVNGAINPMMLKQLLKRSNGTSLSEILQRHNLSLTDLLQGRDEAISAINADASEEPQQLHYASPESDYQLNRAESKYPKRRTSPREKIVTIGTSSDEETKGSNSNGNIENVESIITTNAPEIDNRETRPKMSTKRRFPTGIRRKLRMRPMLNSTLKAQLSRDLIALSARKYSHNNKNVSKSREWKDIVPMMVDKSKTDDETSKDDVTEHPTATTTTDAPIDTTLEITNSSYSIAGGEETKNVKEVVDENALTTTEATTTIIIEVLPAEMTTEAEKPKVTPIVKPSATNSTLRRQAFNNRLKRKRLKQKTSTTENPTDDLMRNFLGMANLVSASQFIERTQKPYTTVKQENTEFATELEDFMTTQAPAIDSVVKSIQVTTTRFSTKSTTKSLPEASSTTTEQSAKFEIEEILNDTMTSERLAKILRERNMTLSELVNHRERGSSHVHLADIFHNASKEPNPPEPFLTKSSIEPISKETYPLRAILEANTHETTTRSQGDQKNYIPVVMDFGNNVNENGESMGIISLFNKLTDSEVAIDKTEIRKDSDGTPYVSSVMSVNATNTNDTNRESRGLTDSEDWSELLSFMKARNISTFEEDLQTLIKGDAEKESLEDLDDMMIMDDIQHLHNFENNIASGADENIEMNMFERRENLSEKPGILNKLPNNTKSVAIATASILGLAAILFLLTYIAFKWKQQRNKLRKKESFCDVQIPSPVFENRKGHKNNCSSRSISPMISNTNIYMSTLESSGKESPDYMWNSLRKPFQ